MASGDPDIEFDCPKCDKRLSAAADRSGESIYCPHCAAQVHIPGPMSMTDQLLAGIVDDDEPDHPGTLKIDGISNAAEDGSSWHIKCDICDSVLLVSDQQVGSKVKCNDCFSMLEVKPNKAKEKVEAGTGKGSTLEIVEDVAVVKEPKSEPTQSDNDELTLMPAIELDPEIASAQKESLLEDIVAEEDPLELTEEILKEVDDEPISLMDPVEVSKPPASEVFALEAEAREPAILIEDSNADDSDEEIELINVAPEVANQQLDAFIDDSPQALPRMPRKGKQPAAIPVDEGTSEAPVRVHAKKRSSKSKSSRSAPPATHSGTRNFDFAAADVTAILDKSLGVLKTGNIWIWALGCITLMATGSAIWHALAPQMARDQFELGHRMYYWGIGWLAGRSLFFGGYLILLFVGAVIFRETARGESKVDSVSASDRSNFFSTMLLFGFPMFIAALPMVILWETFFALPFQLFLAGVFLFGAWKNQSPFQIVSGSIAESFSFSDSWKNWTAGTGIAAAGCIIGGMLLEAYWPVISIFTSIVGAFIVVVSTLLYAAVSGWHCGGVVEKMNSSD